MIASAGFKKLLITPAGVTFCRGGLQFAFLSTTTKKPSTFLLLFVGVLILISRTKKEVESRRWQPGETKARCNLL